MFSRVYTPEDNPEIVVEEDCSMPWDTTLFCESEDAGDKYDLSSLDELGLDVREANPLWSRREYSV